MARKTTVGDSARELMRNRRPANLRYRPVGSRRWHAAALIGTVTDPVAGLCVELWDHHTGAHRTLTLTQHEFEVPVTGPRGGTSWQKAPIP